VVLNAEGFGESFNVHDKEKRSQNRRLSYTVDALTNVDCTFSIINTTAKVNDTTDILQTFR